MANNIIEIDASGSHKHWITALKMAKQPMKSCVYVLAQFLFIFVSAYIYKLEKEKNTSWMREVCYWQLKS